MNPYFTGVHTPLRSELTLENLPITGSIPAGFDGRYLRMGPNPMNASPSRYHWFAGDGMVHGIRIERGRALWYRNRWIRSGRVSKALNEPRVPGPLPREGEAGDVIWCPLDPCYVFHAINDGRSIPRRELSSAARSIRRRKSFRARMSVVSVSRIVSRTPWP
jgi:carotenoid cleavage dioxygenase-like enzyme